MRSRFPLSFARHGFARDAALALLAGLLASVMALTGCGPRQTAAEVAARERTLILGNAAEPADLDPHLATTLSDQVIINALFEGLTVLDEKTARPLPAAAESWEVSTDGLVWSFRLRPGLRWSNGDPLTAADFVKTWRRALSPQFAADNAWYLFVLKNAAAYNAGLIGDAAAIGVTAPDPHTLVLTLEQPAPYLPALLSLPAWFPLHSGNLEKFGATTQRGRPWTRPGELIGNGAYRLEAWAPNARLTLALNPQHRDATSAQVERLVFLPIEKPEDEERAYRAGQLHVSFSLPVTKIASWRARAPEQLRVEPLLQSHFLRFNIAHPALADPRVRRALSLALDREKLARSVLQASRAPAYSLVPPHSGDYTAATLAGAPSRNDSDTGRGTASPAATSIDAPALRALLAQAGYANPKDFPRLELLVRSDELMPRVAEAIQAMWKTALGIEVTIAQREQKTWVQAQQTGDYSLCLSAWTADYPAPLNFLELFTSDSPYNWTGWASPRYDALLAAAAHSAQPDARLARLREAEALLLDEGPIAPLYFGAETRLVSPAVKNWTPAPLGFRRFQLLRFAD